MTASRYEVLGHLAQGGMGEILLARRIGPAGFEKLVVLKRPLPMGRGTSQLVGALIEEARLLARINHPNVCQVHDLEEAEGQYFLALEYLDGLSLWTMLADAEDAKLPIDPRVVCGIGEQICDGLDAIHTLRNRDDTHANVVHRDISPGNLFVTESGVAKILDLGIAKSTDSEEPTPFGRVKGKLPYLSPEQVAGKPIDGRADLFALGLVLYDLAVARRPPRDRVGALACNDLDLSSVPPPLATTIRSAVAADPTARFASAKHMAAALREAGAALGGSASRAEISEWLAKRFAVQLAKQRAMAHVSRAPARPSTATHTHTLTLHSVIHDAGSADFTAAAASGRSYTEQAPLLSRQTERLALPDDERVAMPGTIDQLAVSRLASVPPPGRSRRGQLVIASAVLFGALLIVAASAVRGSRAASEDALPVAKAAPAEPTPTPPIATETAPPSTPTISTPPPTETPPPVRIEPTKRARKERTRREAPPPSTTAREQAEETGLLTVDSRPYANVKLGDDSLGPTPIYHKSIKAGSYRIHATTSDGREQTVTVKVEAGKERRLLLDWSKR